MLENFSARKPTLAVASAGIPAENLINVQGFYGVDPHLWMDVSLWAMITDPIAAALSELAPECAEAIAARSEAYREQLEALDDWVRQSVASVPESQRLLVTAHDAFGYYARAYGLEVAAIQGLSTESEAGIGDIRETVDIVVERQVPAIFVETTINPRTIEALLEAARDREVTTVIGGSLYSDAMGEDGTRGGTYIGMIYENTVTITEALGGSVPDLPEALADWAAQWEGEAND